MYNHQIIPKTQNFNIIVFLDFPNYIGAISAKLHPICLNWLERFLDGLGKIDVRNLYLFKNNGLENSPYLPDFRSNRWEIINRTDKEDIDTWLTIDAAIITSRYRRKKKLIVVIIAGDSDYLYPLEKIVQLGSRGILITTQEIKHHKSEGVEIVRLPKSICPKCGRIGVYQEQWKCWKCEKDGCLFH